MVLESLFNPFIVKKKPWEMFLAGFIYTLVGLALSLFVFKEVASILLVFLIVIAILPMFYTTLKTEEELDLHSDQEWRLLREHGKVITFLLFMFLGITAALVLSYTFLPEKTTNIIFHLQEKAITNVNSNLRGAITGGTTQFDFFIKILVNNLKVLFFCLVFSLLYGTGAIFILTWNASVIATAMGNLFKNELAQISSLVGFPYLSAYFSAATMSFFRYMTHGILEITAYFIIALAGGILSVAIVRHNLENERVLIDTLDLIFISLGILVIAGVVEVYITPMLFM